jgi:hypothetical protein
MGAQDAELRDERTGTLMAAAARLTPRGAVERVEA